MCVGIGANSLWITGSTGAVYKVDQSLTRFHDKVSIVYGISINTAVFSYVYQE